MKTNIFYKIIKLKILEAAINILFDKLLKNFKTIENRVLPENLYLGQQLKEIRSVYGPENFERCKIVTILSEERKFGGITYAISFSYYKSNISGDFDEFSMNSDTILVDNVHVHSLNSSWIFIE
jgi:hypothetical protein